MRVAGARNQAEAELIQSILLEEGMPSILRRSAGFDVPDFLAAGRATCSCPRPVPSRPARCCSQADVAPTTGERRAPRPLLLAVAVGLGGAATALLAWLAFQGT